MAGVAYELAQKRHWAGLHCKAIEVALQAKALKECCFPGHSDWPLDRGDEATRLAYTIGTDRWKTGKLMASTKNLGASKGQPERVQARSYRRVTRIAGRRTRGDGL